MAMVRELLSFIPSNNLEDPPFVPTDDDRNRRDPELALDVANAYMRVARVQGVPVSSNLGQMDEAEKSLRLAED